ncbi:phosphate acyltransferase PlsX [Aurantivibrio plasticivorans]
MSPASKIRIAIDAMGGDLGPHPILSAARRFASSHPQIDIILVAQLDALDISLLSNLPTNLSTFNASDIVLMDDTPATVLRHRQQSSMWKTLELVKSQQVDACVSSGNTGALMAIGRHLLKTYSGIDRPAICKPLPATNGRCYLLDLGANINCTAQQLEQFATMGAVLAQVAEGCARPKVGLLNIGEENIKGVEPVKEAALLLQQNEKINYVGFVEGDDIYTGNVDVVVCDGFLGNIALKVSEGAAKFLAQSIHRLFSNQWYGRFMGLLAAPVVNQFRAKFDPARYNGASLLGLQGTVIKSHGAANELSFYYAIEMAVRHVENQIPQKINAQFTNLYN